ncbi:MAG: ThiF family adenylyltransferase [Calothrix sp. MO_167.B12]|nr:ThiF family adenylyltransferase [Calothrix sp. MO_167.B12]
MTTASLTLQEQHWKYLQEILVRTDGAERAAYVLCGLATIDADPWDGQPHHKFISYEAIPVPEEEIVSSSAEHITWKTDSLVHALKTAQAKDLTVAIFHSHPGGLEKFSAQDDANEPDLIELAQNRNGSDTKLLSVILTPLRKLVGRLWINQQEFISLQMIRVVGESIRLHYPNRGQGVSSPAFQRQALAFGEALNQDLSMLRVGVIGCGGTGSAIAMLLPKMAIRQIALFDKDIVEESNLNRLHGATLDDARAQRPKVEVIKRVLTELGLGIEVRTYQSWVGETECRQALKACDILFCCTDDHTGRLMLNRFAYYYATPIFDMGLAVEISHKETAEIKALDGRITVLVPAPGHACLLCREVINPVIARDETLKRSNPTEYERQKAEAYVIGEGNPSPAVVLFTTEVAIMAMEELVHRLQGFRGEDGMAAHRVRKFHLTTDRKPAAIYNLNCPVCGNTGAEWWGRGDVIPFLNVVG